MSRSNTFINLIFFLSPEIWANESDIEEEIDGKTYQADYYQSERGNYLCVNGYFFLRNTISQNTMSWRCTLYRSFKCRARAKTDFARPGEALLGIAHHTHDREGQRNIRRQKLEKKPLTKP